MPAASEQDTSATYEHPLPWTSYAMKGHCHALTHYNQGAHACLLQLGKAQVQPWSLCTKEDSAWTENKWMVEKSDKAIQFKACLWSTMLYCIPGSNRGRIGLKMNYFCFVVFPEMEAIHQIAVCRGSRPGHFWDSERGCWNPFSTRTHFVR